MNKESLRSLKSEQSLHYKDRRTPSDRESLSTDYREVKEDIFYFTCPWWFGKYKGS